MPRLALVVWIASWVSLVGATTSGADTTPQALPFTQAWSDTSLITSPNDWSEVPGVLGIRGDDLTMVIGIDPQTILGEQGTVNVIPNQSNPNLTTGGVAEFDGLANPAVAFQGSGTADAPYVQVTIVTTGISFVRVRYVLRDLDASADNSVQPVALQYRVGTIGNFTNVPAGFVSDATSGPSLAGQLTAVDVVLPAEVGNQPVVQVRMITSNATGNDEWVGIDDIAITDASTPPTAVANANPAMVDAGNPTLLTAAVTPGIFPSSTFVTVACDLTAIGGSADQPLFDDGAHNDGSAGDGVYAFEAIVAPETPGGPKSLPVVVEDAEGRSSATSIDLTVVSQVGVTPGGTARMLVVGVPFPNPFRASSAVEFEIRHESRVRVVVLDLRGRLVAVLGDASFPAGRHRVTWTGLDQANRRVVPGAYWCRIETAHDSAARRLLVLD
jgi:hypothetical protein